MSFVSPRKLYLMSNITAKKNFKLYFCTENAKSVKLIRACKLLESTKEVGGRCDFITSDII